jgi:hypothetical protein
MRRVLTAALGVALIAAPAQAAHYIFNLTGNADDTITGAFSFDGVDYETGSLELTGFTPFTLQDGDTFEATVTISGSSPPPFPNFIVPLRDQMFFGLNFSDLLGGAQPTTASVDGLMRFDGGADVPVGCGNCTSLILGQNATPLGFNVLIASGMFSLSDPYEINSISISYQVNNDPTGAIPEPGAWAMMILGFGGVGAILRLRRRSDTFAAA